MSSDNSQSSNLNRQSLARYLWAMVRITFKRLAAQPGLSLATLGGLVTAVALLTAVPLYADAASFRILEQALAQDSNRPAFAYLYRYVGTWYGPLQWEGVAEVDDYLSNRAGRDIGLPQQFLVRHFETDKYHLFPAGINDYSDPTQALDQINLVTTSGIADHITIFEGQFPAPAGNAPQDPLPVLIADSFATQFGLQVGDSLLAFNPRDRLTPNQDIPLQVAGIWQANDPNDPFWFYKPDLFRTRLIIPEESFVNRLVPALSDEVHLAIWYLVLDGSQVNTQTVGSLVSNGVRVEQRATNLLPNIANEFGPTDGLQQYRFSVDRLTRLLAAFSVPLVGLILIFIGLMVGLAVRQRRNEIAVMRSRGATVWQILALTLVEGLLLGLLALLLGLAGGLLFTQLMGQTRSFLDFSATTGLRVALTDTAWQAGLVAVGLALLSQLSLTVAAAGDTVITYKQELARAIRPPWWQRAWLDVLLFVPAGYAIYLIQNNKIESLVASGDFFQNPLLLFLPTLIAFSLTLFVLRLLPWFMALFSWLLSQTDSVSLLLATRQLSRTPGRYAAPLLLLVLTVSLSVFTASLAQTSDYQLYDEAFYQTGADLNLVGPGLIGVAFGSSEESQNGIFLPISDYLTLPGVAAATRVGQFSTSYQIGGERASGLWLGLDRESFGQVAYWRRDFAPAGLGHLLNQLAYNPDGVLVPAGFMAAEGVRLGDFFRLDISVNDSSVPIYAQIVGTYTYFPSWYPAEESPLFIGNLENLFQQAGGELPYEVWLKTTAAYDEAAFGQALAERGLAAWFWREPYSQISREQLRPERQGLFGLLSVGFATTALLTVIGFGLYTLFSFRSRFIELGVLRAVGLTAGQMLFLVGCELLFLLLGGAGLGLGLGVWISQLFVPVLQLSAPTPPYLVEIAWAAIAQVGWLFGIMFLLALLALGRSLTRMRIFQAIKLGETV